MVNKIATVPDSKELTNSWEDSKEAITIYSESAIIR